jgi:hypothetical protein
MGGKFDFTSKEHKHENPNHQNYQSLIFTSKLSMNFGHRHNGFSCKKNKFEDQSYESLISKFKSIQEKWVTTSLVNFFQQDFIVCFFLPTKLEFFGKV